MCGIWFYTQLINSYNHDKIKKASDEIKKRGPDKSIEKYLSFGNFEMFLTFHRLAIMDLSSAGDQPFVSSDVSSDEQIYLMCNGEIYGYKNLVKEFDLEDKLRSHSDCEILIHLYQQLGLEGMYNILTKRDDVAGEFAIIIIHMRGETCDIHYVRDFCGKRPLYYGEYDNIVGYDGLVRDFDALCFTSQLCGIPFPEEQFKRSGQVPASTYGTYTLYKNSNHIIHQLKKTENLRDNPITIFDETEACDKIYKTFLRVVEDQLVSDREVAFMLSGGLDSSLCAGVGAHILKQKGLENKIKTICIGLEGGTDEAYAKMVAEHIQSNHLHILCTEEEFIECAENRITHKIESYDITSNRASVPQLISAEKILYNTNCKVVIVGDYADEVCGGYNETKYAPSVEDYAERIYELTEDIIYFDGERVDRCIGGSGLEARMPFGDHRFIKLYLSIDPKLRTPKDSCEKYLLRKAFDGKNIIPQQVLWRPKEAFSDGVSSLKRSWYQIVLDYFNEKYSDEDLEKAKEKFKWNTPYTKESLHYRLKFNEKYNDVQARVVPYFWLPKWGNVREPSARVLDVYKQ
jgi:asparagine synthase (glutamine-hydrolysing)